MRALVTRFPGRLLAGLLGAVRRQLASRSGLASLNGLDGRMLRDIGLHSGAIDGRALDCAARERWLRQQGPRTGRLAE